MNLRLMALNLKQFCPQLSIPVIKQRINIRYQQILGMEDWEFLNDSSTISTVSGTSVYEVTDASEVTGVSYETRLNERYLEWLNVTDPEREVTGPPTDYIVSSKSKADGGVVSIEVWPEPDDVYSLTVYFKTNKDELTEDTDEPVFRPEVIEAGSKADCYEMEYAVTQNPAYIGLARDARQEFQGLLRQMLIEDLGVSSLPRKVREAGGGGVGGDLWIDHDLEWV